MQEVILAANSNCNVTSVRERVLLFNRSRSVRMHSHSARSQARRAALPSVSTTTNRSQSAIITINDKGIIQSIDRNASVIFGYDLDELHGKKVNILIPSPYKEQHDTYIANYQQTGVKKIIDKRRLVEGLHKDGSIFPIFLSVTEVKVWNVQMYIGAIEKVEDKAVIINTNTDGVITSCNKNVEELLGYTAPELVGKSISVLVPAPHNQKHDNYIQQNFHTGGPLKMLGHVRNLPIKHKNNVVFPVCVQVTQINTSGVTTFRAAIELPPKETVLTIDGEGTILSCNYNFTLPMLGYSQQALIGKNVSMLIPEMLLNTQDNKKRKSSSIIDEWSETGVRRVDLLHQDGSIFTVNLEVLRLHKDAREEENKMYSLQIKRVEGNHAPVTPPVAEVVGEYILGQVLSRTSAGIVRIGVHRQSGDTTAIKILNKKHLTQSEVQRVRREIEINMQLNHPNICKLIEVIDKPDALCLVMEYCEGGDLLAKMHEGQAQSKINAAVHAGEVLEVVLGSPLSEKEAHKIFGQLVSAVQHCHSKAIVHRDIKHKNILFDKQGNVKLIDFGLGNWTLPGAMSFCGTPAYAAPEMLLGVQYMGPEVDVWSMGVVLYSLVTGKLPFLNVVDMVIGQLSVPRNVSADCANLITRMLVVEVAQRATMNEILQHPWVTRNFDDTTTTTSFTTSGLSIDLTQPLSFTSSSLFTFGDCPSPPLSSASSSPPKTPGNS